MSDYNALAMNAASTMDPTRIASRRSGTRAFTVCRSAVRRVLVAPLVFAPGAQVFEVNHSCLRHTFVSSTATSSNVDYRTNSQGAKATVERRSAHHPSGDEPVRVETLRQQWSPATAWRSIHNLMRIAEDERTSVSTSR